MRPTPLPDEFERLLASARDMEPPALPELVARRMVREAVDQASAKRPTRDPRAGWFLAAVAVVLCGVWAARSLWPSGTVLAVDPADHPLRVGLLPGDAVTLAPGSRLELASQTKTSRQIHLSRGTALFDVVKLGAGERFEVVTDQVSVRVLGTVFSVEASEEGTLVRVYEGRVWVQGRALSAGTVWSSRPDLPLGTDSLASQAATAVREREAQRPEAATVQALPEPAIADAGMAMPADDSVARVPVLLHESLFAVTDAGASAAPAASSLSEAGRLLAQGHALDSLVLARTALEQRVETELPWRTLEAQALRALGRFDESVMSYERAASLGRSDESMQLAYDAASLAFHGLHDPARALALMERWSLDEELSPLRERATRLRVQALLALHRRSEARETARQYLEHEPETAVSEEMRRLLGW